MATLNKGDNDSHNNNNNNNNNYYYYYYYHYYYYYYYYYYKCHGRGHTYNVALILQSCTVSLRAVAGLSDETCVTPRDIHMEP